MHDNERLLRAFNEAARKKDYEALVPMLAPDVRAISPSYDVRSADELIEALRAQNDVAEDISTELTVDVVGDKVFWESIWRGTYPGVGKSLELRGLSVAVVRDGRLVHIRQYWDNLAVMTELGLLTSQEGA